MELGFASARPLQASQKRFYEDIMDEDEWKSVGAAASSLGFTDEAELAYRIVHSLAMLWGTAYIDPDSCEVVANLIRQHMREHAKLP